MRVWVVSLALFALIASGCGGIDSGVRDEGGIGAGGRAVVSPPAAVGEAGPRPQAPAPPGVALVYFLRYEQPTPTRRRVDEDRSALQSALIDLVEGPTAAEQSLRYRSALPEGTTLRDVTVTNRVAIVDLSAMPPEGTPGSEALLALYQVVFTATAPPGIDAVRVLVAGRPYGLGSVVGEPNPQEAPLTRADLSFVNAADVVPGALGCAVARGDDADEDAGEPVLQLGAPAEGAIVDGTLRVRGRLLVRSGPIVIRLVQDDLEVLHRVIDDRCLGRFAATIPVPQGLVGDAFLDVYVPGEDGEPVAGVRRAIAFAG
jgi:hypothetical protein